VTQGARFGGYVVHGRVVLFLAFSVSAWVSAALFVACNRCARIQLSLQMLSWCRSRNHLDDKVLLRRISEERLSLSMTELNKNILYLNESVYRFIRSSRGLEFQHDEKIPFVQERLFHC